MKLSDSLAQNNAIQLQAEVADWRQAVRLGVDLLVAAGVVEPRYFDAILAGVERHGPYCAGAGPGDAARPAGGRGAENRLRLGHLENAGVFRR